LAYGRKLGDKVSVGIGFNYYAIKLNRYGRIFYMVPEAGIILHANDKISTGIHIFNPAAITNHKYKDEKLPLICTMGLGWNISDKLYMVAELQKEEDRPLYVNTGLEFQPAQRFFIRGGLTSALSSYYFGCGMQIHLLRMDVTASFHPQLGITPAIMFLYNSRK
jgi:hypothetical protein